MGQSVQSAVLGKQNSNSHQAQYRAALDQIAREQQQGAANSAPLSSAVKEREKALKAGWQVLCDAADRLPSTAAIKWPEADEWVQLQQAASQRPQPPEPVQFWPQPYSVLPPKMREWQAAGAPKSSKCARPSNSDDHDTQHEPQDVSQPAEPSQKKRAVTRTLRSRAAQGNTGAASVLTTKAGAPHRERCCGCHTRPNT